MQANIFNTLDCQINDSSTFWSSNLQDQEFSSAFLHSGSLSINYKEKGLLTKNFLLSKSSLYLLSKSGGPKYKSNINWKLLQPFEEVCKNSTRYGFQLIGNSQQDFYTNSKEELNEWIEKLSRTSIMNSFDEDFVVIREISKGSTSKVHLVQSVDKEEQFAVKTIQKDLLLTPGLFENLVNEISILRRANHENILSFKRLYESDDAVHIITEYLAYGDGQQILSKKKKISEENGLKIVKQILDGLAYLHSLNFVHRDLKPENFAFVDKEYLHVKIIDFGMACSNKCDLAKKCGTVGYIAPEILKGSLYNTKVDLFSVGVLLFTLISGKNLFTGKNYTERLKKNEECFINFSSPYFRKLEKSTYKLLHTLLNPEPVLRPSANEARNLECFNNLKLKPLYINQDDTLTEIKSPNPVKISQIMRRF
jgi:serine/threonine protein kinase